MGFFLTLATNAEKTLMQKMQCVVEGTADASTTRWVSQITARRVLTQQ